ncbi:MAG: hypothetical protein KME38_24135 [Spirirestis rafaelensis WJT71-NPBG6]|nr:hypothetical protein [Spirirestis rafaelensis WJT71-NPBG6]
MLEVSRLLDVQGYQSQSILARLGSDKLYQQLCLRQECYRARLQIKPCHVGDTVCHWVAQIGEASSIPQNEIIKQLHDAYCLSDGKLA